MHKTFILELSEETFKKAKEVANSRGELITDYLEKEVERIGTLEKGNWINQTSLENSGLGINRVTLWVHRQAGLLKEGEHYITRGKNRVFYNKEKIKQYFSKNIKKFAEKTAGA